MAKKFECICYCLTGGDKVPLATCKRHRKIGHCLSEINGSMQVKQIEISRLENLSAMLRSRIKMLENHFGVTADIELRKCCCGAPLFMDETGMRFSCPVCCSIRLRDEIKISENLRKNLRGNFTTSEPSRKGPVGG